MGTCPPTTDTAGARARAFVRSRLAWHPCRDDVLQCLGELVANALVHTLSGAASPRHAWFEVRLTWTATTVRLEVEDTGALEGRTPRKADLLDLDQAENGRGLLIIDALATAWDSRPSARIADAHVVAAEFSRAKAVPA